MKLILQFQSLDGVYQSLDDVKPPRIQQLLRDHEEAAFDGRELTTIVRDMPVDLDSGGGEVLELQPGQGSRAHYETLNSSA